MVALRVVGAFKGVRSVAPPGENAKTIALSQPGGENSVTTSLRHGGVQSADREPVRL